MKIQLHRPIVFFDLEATGLNRESDRIVEYSFVKLHPDSSRETIKSLINPQMPIPPEVSKIHGLDDDNVKNAPIFAEKAAEVYGFIAGCDIAGFHSNSFDIPLLYNEFRRAGIEWQYSDVAMIDVANIFKIQAPRDLSAALMHYCGKEHNDAHTAEADVNATIEVFLAQIEHLDAPGTINDIALYSNYGKPVLDLSGKFTLDDNGQVIFNFGQHKGLPAMEHIEYVMWMHQKDFASDTIRICDQLIRAWLAK